MKLAAIKYALVAVPVLLFCLVPVGAAQTGAVKGKVKELDGKSLEGVLVTATSTKNKADNHETTSDAKGDFEFTSLPAGDYSFSFEKKGYKTFLSRALSVIGGETLRLRTVVELKRDEAPFSIIRGAVFYDQGYSLPNAGVKIERIDGKRFKEEKLSGEGGQFAFRLKAEKAKYRVTAFANGFQPVSTEIEIEGDEIRNIALTLQREK
ncbi:MAG: carboxypeptidase-like regulatory domain-containing protein [Acidobacteriota bacterium]|nr:carboxypeptidase-like regulatory domain-containing protein [Acidobacteriota bacterium]